jgi:hypothetical protein
MTNETERETTRAPQPAKPTPADRWPCGQPVLGCGGHPRARWRVFRYDHGHEPKPEAPRDREVTRCRAASGRRPDDIEL